MRRANVIPALLWTALAGVAGAAEPPAAVQPSAMESREARSDQLLALKEHLAAMASDDAGDREQAQDALMALGESFRDEIDAALASAKNLEIRTRLKEVLEAWARQEAYDRRLTSNRNGNFYTGNGEHSQELRYALSAIPQSYDQSVRSSFQINNTGTVYSQDRGAQVMVQVEFDPEVWVVSE